MTKFRKHLSRIMIFILVLTFISVGTVSAYTDVPHHVYTRLANTVILYIGSPKALIDRNIASIDSTNKEVYPIVTGGRTLVPIRFISEAIGAKVEWDTGTSTATIKYEGKDIKLKLGSNEMLVNGKVVKLDVTATTIEGRLFIPLRALVEALGKEVFYHDGLIIISEIANIYDVNRDQVCINSIIDLFIKNNSKIESMKEESISYALYEKYDKAINLANEILKLDPSSPVGYYAMAEVMGFMDREDEAISWYLKAIEMDNTYIEAYYSLGFALMELELYEDALEVYNEIIKMAPTYVSAYNIKASVLEDMFRYEEAIEAYDKAIEFHPDFDFYYYKGILFGKLGRYEEALESFDIAINFDSEYEMTYIEKGIILSEMGRYDEAIEIMDLVIEMSDYYLGYVYKAVYLAELGQYDAAIKILDYLIKEIPGYNYPIYLKGLILEAKQK